MQKQQVFDAEEFNLSFRAYLNYVSRKIRKDENYEPYPLVKAIANAIEGAKNEGKPGNYAGISGDAHKHSDGEAKKVFFCVIELNKDDTYTLLEVYDVSLGKPVPIKVASYILLLSMKFDKFEGEFISVTDFIKTINETIPKLNLIRFNNDEWEEARDFLADNIDTVNIPFEMHEEYQRDFNGITKNTLWEYYPPRVRTTIAMVWMENRYKHLYKDGCINSVNTYLSDKYLKSNMLNSVLMMLYGQMSEHFEDITNWKHFSDLNMIENKQNKRTKIGRNKPCPCYSGKKFKNCCGK